MQSNPSSIIAKLHREMSNNKIWAELMLWHLDQYRNAKQGISIFKTYIGNTNRALLSPTYRNFLEAWSDMTENEYPNRKLYPKYITKPSSSTHTQLIVATRQTS